MSTMQAAYNEQLNVAKTDSRDKYIELNPRYFKNI